MRALYFDTMSGGVNKQTSRPALFGYVMCDQAVDGKVAHSCRHGLALIASKFSFLRAAAATQWKQIDKHLVEIGLKAKAK